MAYPQTVTGNSGTYATASVATPITPMQEARQGLTCSINLLHERIGELGRRLETVLRPATPTPDANNANKLETQPSEHRQFLAMTTSEVHGLVGRLEDLLNRIEL